MKHRRNELEVSHDKLLLFGLFQVYNQHNLSSGFFVNESQLFYKPLRRAESGTDGGILLWNNQNCLNLGTKYVFSSMDPITYSTTLNEKCLFLKTSVSVEFKNKGLETLNASLHTEFITLFCLFPINCITQSLRRQIYLISLCQFYLSALETVVINSS